MDKGSVLGWAVLALALLYLLTEGFVMSSSDAASTALTVPRPAYAIVDLGIYDGQHSEAQAINNSGQIIFNVYHSNGGWKSHHWDDGVISPLNMPRGEWSYAWGITDLAQVSGFVYADTDNIPVLWDNPVESIAGITWTVVELGALVEGGRASAWDVNHSGQVVGRAATVPPITYDHACLWYNGVITDLGTLGGPTSFATGINDVGQVVGAADDPDGMHPFLWEDSVMKDLSTLGGPRGVAWDINNNGQIVGGLGQTAFLWASGVLTDLGGLDPDYPYAEAFAINDNGVIVGRSWYGARIDPSYAFVWKNGTWTDLNNSFFLDTEWERLEVAFDINNSRWIVGRGRLNGVGHAFLAIPLLTTYLPLVMR